MHIKRSPMTCRNDCIELCKACSCCFYHKLVLRRSKWCFYSHVFNTKLQPLSLVAAQSPWFCFFFLQPSACFRIVPALLANQHSWSCADMRSRWYALKIKGRGRFSSSSSPSSKRLSCCLNKGFHLWYLMRIEPRRALLLQTKWDEMFDKCPTQKTGVRKPF